MHLQDTVEMPACLCRMIAKLHRYTISDAAIRLDTFYHITELFIENNMI